MLRDRPAFEDYRSRQESFSAAEDAKARMPLNEAETGQLSGAGGI